jgi:hypothetical protein
LRQLALSNLWEILTALFSQTSIDIIRVSLPNTVPEDQAKGASKCMVSASEPILQARLLLTQLAVHRFSCKTRDYLSAEGHLGKSHQIDRGIILR